MSRRSSNFPPGIWQARREYDRQRYNRNESNPMNSTEPTTRHPNPFQNSYREVDPIPRRPAEEIDPVPWRPAREMDPVPWQPAREMDPVPWRPAREMDPVPWQPAREMDPVPWRPVREMDSVPWRPVGETMFARILNIGGPQEESPAIVRIITHSRPRQREEASRRPSELYTPTPRSEGIGNSMLTPEEQNTALNKLNKKVYNPPNNTSRRTNFNYRRNHNQTSTSESYEESKQCAVCLEDFRPKEEVMTTPCNHMFHEQCIVPWVKSHGQCPNCRFAMFERTGRREAPFTNNASIAPASSLIDGELVYLIRAMEDAMMLRDLAGFWGG